MNNEVWVLSVYYKKMTHWCINSVYGGVVKVSTDRRICRDYLENLMEEYRMKDVTIAPFRNGVIYKMIKDNVEYIFSLSHHQLETGS